MPMNNLPENTFKPLPEMDSADYFPALLKEAVCQHAIRENELITIQAQLMEILHRRVVQFAGHENGSIRIESANELLRSILYAVGFLLKQHSVEAAVEIVKVQPLGLIYENSLRLLEKKYHSARSILQRVKKQNFINSNIAYNDTVYRGMDPFFAQYDWHLSAHETPGSIDYPLFHDEMKTSGIEYIHQYLSGLYWENRFCTQFSPQLIARLLKGYDEASDDLLINIFRLVFTNALGCILLEKDPLLLDISPAESRKISILLENRDKGKELLEKAAYILLEQFHIKYTPLMTELYTWLNNPRSPKNMDFITLSILSPSLSQNRFQVLPPMEDESLRFLEKELQNCRYTSDKIAILKHEVHNPDDLITLLSSGCIRLTEYTEIFTAYTKQELSLLYQCLPQLKNQPTEEYPPNSWQYALICHMDNH